MSSYHWRHGKCNPNPLRPPCLPHACDPAPCPAPGLLNNGHRRSDIEMAKRIHRLPRPRSHPCPETHARAQPLQFEGPNGRNGGKSTITGMPVAALDPTGGVPPPAPFPIAKSGLPNPIADPSTGRPPQPGRVWAMPPGTDVRPGARANSAGWLLSWRDLATTTQVTDLAPLARGMQLNSRGWFRRI
jgi:hypothetical protein